MKKILAAAICLMLSAASCGSTRIVPSASYPPAEAPSTTSADTTEPATEKPTEPKKPVTVEEPVSTSFASAFMSLDDGFWYHKYNVDEPIAPASLTKLLTACTALKYLTAGSVITVGTEIYMVQPNSSLCYIKEGQQLTLCDLLKGLLLSSGNDAAYTVAVNCARSIEPNIPMTDSEAVQYFCYKMNELASEFGMENSHFTSPDGWDDWSQYTTVSDLFTLTQKALEDDVIRDITSSAEDTAFFLNTDPKSWKNSNRLLHPDDEYYCRYATGVKTGSTVNAGYCLIACFEKDGKRYLSAVTGCDSDEDRYAATLELFNRYTAD